MNSGNSGYKPSVTDTLTSRAPIDALISQHQKSKRTRTPRPGDLFRSPAELAEAQVEEPQPKKEVPPNPWGRGGSFN